MDDWDFVILVDAVPRGGQPGTVYVIEPELPPAGAAPFSAGDGAIQFDAHTMNPVAVLQLVAALGGEVKRMIVVGCEPSAADPEEAGMELSAPVLAAVDEAIRAIEELVANFPRTTLTAPDVSRS